MLKNRMFFKVVGPSDLQIPTKVTLKLRPLGGHLGGFRSHVRAMLASWEGFWRVLDAKLEAKLTKKLIKWPLVGKLAEKAKMIKKHLFFEDLLVPRPSNFEGKLAKDPHLRPKIGHLGPKMRPCWEYLRPRWLPKSRKLGYPSEVKKSS